MRALRARVALVTSGEDREKGLSLVELLVTVIVFGFLLTMMGGFMVNANRALGTDKAISSTNRTASTAMNEVTRVLRGAATNPVVNQTVPDPAFVTAGDNTLTVYSYINLTTSIEQPIRVMFFLNGTTLTEWTWQPTVSNGYYTFPSAATCATSCTSKIVAQQIVLGSAGGPASLFTYVDSTGTTISTAAGTLPTAQIKNVAAVTVTLQVGATSSANQSTLLTNTVGLPNLNIARTN